MKSLEYVKEHIDEIEQDHMLDQRWTTRFMQFLSVDEIEKYGYTYTGEGTREPVEWTEENIIKQLKSDVEFAIEKAVNHRGISASLMYFVLQSWCIVLENGLEDTDYGWYGDKLILAIDEKYDFGLTDGEFNADFYAEW